MFEYKEENQKKKINIKLILIPILVLILLGAITYISINLYIDNHYSELYCNTEMCYKITSDNEIKKYYKDENVIGDINLKVPDKTCNLESKMCDEKIIKKKKDILILEKDGQRFYYFPYLKKEDEKTQKIDLSNRLFKNDNSEIYFLNNKIVIFGSKSSSQRKEEYKIIKGYQYNYVIESTTTPYYNTNTYMPPMELLYDYDSDQIYGYEEAKPNKMEYINLKYYDENGNTIITDDDYKFISGIYKLDNEVIIDNKIIKYNKEEKLFKNTIVIGDINDDYVYLATHDFVYNKKRDTLCRFEYKRSEDEVVISAKEHCYKKINESDLRMLNKEE